jgi:hypothetical protein
MKNVGLTANLERQHVASELKSTNGRQRSGTPGEGKRVPGGAKVAKITEKRARA